MTEALTRSLGTFVSELRLAAIPSNALSVVHTGFADCVGTMIAGSVEDRNIDFSFMAEAQGVSFQVTYTGTIEDKDSMKGKVDLGGQAQGTFTAKRQSPGNQASAVKPCLP